MKIDTSIESRLARLERQNLRLRRAGIVVATLLGAVPILGFAVPEDPQDAEFRIVSASKFSLKDPGTGKTRGELSHQTVEGGWAGLTLLDDEGRPRAEFKLWGDGRTVLVMSDEKGEAEAFLEVDAKGISSFALDGRPIAGK